MKQILQTKYRPTPKHRTGLGPFTLGDVTISESSWLALPPALQQSWQDCVANSTALGVLSTCVDQITSRLGISWDEALRRIGRVEDGALPSRRWIYLLLRGLIGEIGQDSGGYVADAFEAMRIKGFPTEAAVRYSDDPVVRDQDLAWSDDELAIDQAYVKGARRITSSGSGRILDVTQALTSGHRVVWGTSLDQAFLDLHPGQVWPGVRGTVVGGHAMLLRGHRTRAGTMSHLEFCTRSSWSPEYCENGDAWIDQGAIASEDADDFWVLETAPEPSELIAGGVS